MNGEPAAISTRARAPTVAGAGGAEKADDAVAPARIVRASLLVLAVALSSAALARWFAHRVPLALVLGRGFDLVAAALGLALLLEALALARLFAGRRWSWGTSGSSGTPRTSGTPALFADLRKVVVAAGLGWGGFLAFVQPFERLWFDVALGLDGGLFAALLLLADLSAPLPWRLRRGLDIASFSVCVAALLAEIGLRGLALHRPSPLLVRSTMQPSEVLDSNRKRPGQVYFGFRFNEAGYFDDAFERRRPGQCRIATVGDSFSLGVVPHVCHYTTVCERRLGCPVDNFGVPGAGLREYEQLLVEEIWQLDPRLVVIGAFIGNDLSISARQQGTDVRLRSWFDREQVLLALVPVRLSRIAAEKRRRGGDAGAAHVQGEDTGRVIAEADLESVFPWLWSPELEQGTISEGGFLELEVDRARLACGDLPWMADFQAVLEDILAAAPSPSIVVMLIPDEFQVEDELWEAIRARVPEEPLDRDRPQRLITAWLAERGIACLDLLPILRAVPPLADGSRHLYHLRDTHWNARGNEVAGEALARFLAPLLR